MKCLVLLCSMCCRKKILFKCSRNAFIHSFLALYLSNSLELFIRIESAFTLPIGRRHNHTILILTSSVVSFSLLSTFFPDSRFSTISPSNLTTTISTTTRNWCWPSSPHLEWSFRILIPQPKMITTGTFSRMDRQCLDTLRQLCFMWMILPRVYF